MWHAWAIASDARLLATVENDRGYGVLRIGALGGDRHHVVAALEHWLPRWRDAGMEFVTMESPSAVEMANSTRRPRA